MRATLWAWIVRLFEAEFTAACLAAESEGYTAGYEAAQPPDGAFKEVFQQGYEAAQYDAGWNDR